MIFIIIIIMLASNFKWFHDVVEAAAVAQRVNRSHNRALMMPIRAMSRSF